MNKTKVKTIKTKDRAIKTNIHKKLCFVLIKDK